MQSANAIVIGGLKGMKAFAVKRGDYGGGTRLDLANV